MPVALFDLDDTLIAGDSDHLWGEFLVAQGLVDAHAHREANDRFLEDYRQGRLDVQAFLAFQLAPLVQRSMDELARLRSAFVEAHIRPIVLDAGRALVDSHRSAGRAVAIATSTNRFITEPIAALLGIDTLLATEPEIVDSRYTGRVVGEPCSGAGKIVHARAWLERRGERFEGSWFYSDSAQDLPLLETVTHPVAVDPDDRLRAVASTRGWPIVTLRGAESS